MRQINRFAVIPRSDTPHHISNIRIFDDENHAISHAAMTAGEIMPCLDTDALVAYQRGKTVRRRSAVTAA